MRVIGGGGKGNNTPKFLQGDGECDDVLASELYFRLERYWADIFELN